jgi:GNAT superfamily N-acetyltransferase
MTDFSAVRDAQEADAPQLASLLRSIGWFSALSGMSDVELVGNVGEHLRALVDAPDSTTLVAVTDDGEITGYANVHWLTALFMPAPEGYLSELFVRPEARGQGIGRSLLDHVEAVAASRGAHRLMLVNRKDRESYQRGFYPKNGWREREDMANFVLSVGQAPTSVDR